MIRMKACLHAGWLIFLLRSVTFLYILTGEGSDTMARKNSLQDRIGTRIAERKEAAYLTREFADLGEKRQVLRALAKAVTLGQLVRLGYGVYGPATKSRLTGRPMLSSPGGFAVAARVALTKLGVAWEPTEWERAYNEGLSTQVPVNPQVKVRGRFSRKLRNGPTELFIDR